MQFNPIFLPSNPVTNISNGKNIKAFENAKYLFSDLVKVESDTKPFNKLINELIQESDIDLHKTISDNKLEINFKESDETQFKSQSTSESNPSIIVILNSLYSSILQNSNIHSVISNVNNDTKPIEEIVIKNVDAKMLQQFLLDLKFNSSGANLSFTDLESDDHSDQNSLIKDIPNSSKKLTHFSIEEVIKHLENNTKVSFKLNKFATDGKVMNSESKLNQIEDLNITLDPEKVKENTTQSNNIGTQNKLTNSLNLNIIKEGVNFRINDLSDNIVKIHNNISDSIKVNNSEKVSSLNPKNNSEGNVIKVEIIEQKLPLDTFKNMNIGNELKQYSVAIKITKQLSTNTQIHSLQIPFVGEHAIKKLKKKNDKLNELRKELSKIFIDTKQVKTEDKSIANKNIPVTAKQHIDEKEVIQNQTKRKDSSSIKTGKIFSTELRENQSITQNKFEPDKISPELKKTGNDFFIDTEKNKELSIDVPKKINVKGNSFTEQQINIIDKDGLNEIIRSSSENKVSRTKLLNSLEVFNKVSELIENKEKKNIEIKLNPPELGKMKVQVDYTEKKLYVRIEVENETAKQLLFQNLEQLKQTINQSSVQLKDVFVSLTSGEPKQQKSSDTRKRGSSNNSNSFSDVEQVKIADKLIANKNIPVTAKQHIDEKEVIQNQTKRKDSQSIKTGKIFSTELRENQSITQNKFEPDKIAPEPKKTEYDFFINTENNKELTVDGSKKVNLKENPFIEQQINIIDKDGLNEIIRSSSESKVSRAKLLNSLEVFNKVSELIENKEKKSIEIKLNPPELGKMKVQVDYTEKKLYVRIEVENETAKQLLSQNLEQLKQTINQSGVQLKDVFVSLTSGEPKQQKSSDTRKRGSSNNSNSFIEDPDTEMSSKMMGYNTYDYLI